MDMSRRGFLQFGGLGFASLTGSPVKQIEAPDNPRQQYEFAAAAHLIGTKDLTAETLSLTL